MANNIFPETLRESLDVAIRETPAHAREVGGDNALRAFTRRSALPMETLLLFMLCMKGGPLRKEIHDAGLDVTPAAVSQRRKKINSSAVEHVFTRFNELCTDPLMLKGYRVMAIDGSAINIPRDPKSPSFMWQKSYPQGYNQLHANLLFDVLNNTFFDCVIQPQPRRDEIGALLFFLRWHDFLEKTIIVADRGYESYNMFASLIETPNVYFVFRIKDERAAMQKVKALPMQPLDVDISFTITTTQTKIDKQNGYIFVQKRRKDKAYSKNTDKGRWDHPSPYPMTLRIVRAPLSTGKLETLATNLPRGQFDAQEIQDIYAQRWRLETYIRHVKYPLNLTKLHGRGDDNARQEIFAALTMSNFANRVAREMPSPQSDRKYEQAYNLSMAVSLCKEFCWNPNLTGEWLLSEIAKHTEDIRPGRQRDRALRSKSFQGFNYRMP